MPTTRPGFIWSGTEWVAIGQEAVVNPFYYQATAPTGAATGAIWIESDVDVPSIDSSQFLRWRKTMTGGETSLSGNDDSSLPLAYTPGYEQLYINGVLQVRGGDYTATTGTTVTGLTALVANDVVEIFSAVARTVADVYTQTQSDARFVNRNTGLFNTVSATKTDAFSTTSVGTWIDIPGLSVTITPTSSTSKFLVIVNIVNGGIGNHNMFNIVRNGTHIAQPPTDTYSSTMGSSIAGNVDLFTSSITHLDAPATLSPVTYKINCRTSGATLFVNRRGDMASVSAVSSITVIEVGA